MLNWYWCLPYRQWCPSSLLNKSGRELKEQKYDVVWIEFPFQGQHVRHKRYAAHVAQLCIWATLCFEIGTQFTIFGSTGQKWSDPQIQALLSDGKLQIAKHRACHFGIKPDSFQQQPSGSCFATACTLPIPWHKCKCNIPIEQHRLDWHTTPTSQCNLKIKASIAI